MTVWHNPETHLHPVDTLHQHSLYGAYDYDLYVFRAFGDVWVSDRYSCWRMSDIAPMIGAHIPEKETNLSRPREGLEEREVSGWALRAMSGLAHGEEDTYWSRIFLRTGPARSGLTDEDFASLFHGEQRGDEARVAPPAIQILAAQRGWSVEMCSRALVCRVYDERGAIRVLSTTGRPQDYEGAGLGMVDLAVPEARQAIVGVARWAAGTMDVDMPRALSSAIQLAGRLTPATRHLAHSAEVEETQGAGSAWVPLSLRRAARDAIADTRPEPGRDLAELQAAAAISAMSQRA
jgi:hypothetical protein